MSTEIKTQVVVLGAGPAGYSAAFRCADLGLETVIVERYNTLGGVCLNVGCIPSKALLHVAKVIEEAKALAEHGIVFGEPKTDIDKIRTWKEKVITQLTGGLAGMAKGRKVKVVNGLGKFTGANTLEVEGENGKTVINFICPDVRYFDFDSHYSFTSYARRGLTLSASMLNLVIASATTFLSISPRLASSPSAATTT